MAQNKETRLDQWKEKIRSGQKFQQDFALSNEWGRYKDYVRHKGFSPGVLPVNIMHSILRSMVPQIYFRNPKVCVTPRKPGLEAELHARIVQKIDNWMIAEVGLKREFKRMIADNFFCGVGVGFFGYDSLYGFSERLSEDGQNTFSQFDTKGSFIEFNSNTNPGMPWFLRARPEDVVFPWGSTNIETLEWVALRVFRQLSDLKADKKYSNTSDLQGTFVPKRTSPEGAVIRDINQEPVSNEQVQWVELWQIHDRRTGRIYALTMDHDKFLRNEPDDLQIEYLPVEAVSFNPDPDYIYGVPDARLIEPQLLELNDIRTQAMKHRRIDIIKALYRKGVLDDEAIQKMTSEQVQALIEVNDEAASLKDVILPLNPGVSGILQDMMAQGEVTMGDVREMVGFSRVAMGEYQGKTHVSSEETKKVFQSLNIRLDERRDEMADLLERVVRRFNQVIFQRWTAERVAQVVGPDGAKWWLKFTGPQIKDEYDYHIVAEESPNMDNETKKGLILQAAEVWAKLNQGQIGAGMPVPAEIQRMIFNQFVDTGLDVDKLLAQTQAMGSQMQSMQAQMGGMGSSPESAMNPGMLAQIMQARRQ